MATHERHLELLLGKRVLDAQGMPVGRIEEVRAEQHGDEWVIQEYLLGSTALLERLSAWQVGVAFLRLLGARKTSAGYSVPWQQMDLPDPEQPRLRYTLSDLASVADQPTYAG
jgi:sporulation protein YlmC with PRC-barrel domain